MDEWLRLGFSAELRLTVTALRKRKTELSNFDAYYTIYRRHRIPPRRTAATRVVVRGWLVVGLKNASISSTSHIHWGNGWIIS